MANKNDKKLKKIDELLLRYNIKEKINEKDLKIDKKKETKDISEIAEVKNEEIKIESVDYNIIKDDISRLENYQELMQNYKLNEEQKNAVAEIYNRAKKTGDLINPDTPYKQLSETTKELTELSKRIINEIGGNYIKSIDEYRKTP